MKTTYIRDTNDSFIKVVENQKGETFTRKIERENKTEYSNVCGAFQRHGVSIEIGKEITE